MEMQTHRNANAAEEPKGSNENKRAKHKLLNDKVESALNTHLYAQAYSKPLQIIWFSVYLFGFGLSNVYGDFPVVWTGATRRTMHLYTVL